jgi:chromosome segregation ATPase
MVKMSKIEFIAGRPSTHLSLNMGAKKENEKLKADIKKRDQENKMLHEALQASLDQDSGAATNVFIEEIKKRDQEIEKRDKEIEKRGARNDELYASYKATADESLAHLEESRRRGQELEKCRKTIAELKKRIAELEAEQRENDATHDRLVDDVNQAHKQHRDLVVLKRRLADRVAELEKLVAELEKLKDPEQALKKLKKLEADKQRLEEDKRRLEEDKRRLEKRNAELEAALKEAQDGGVKLAIAGNGHTVTAGRNMIVNNHRVKPGSTEEAVVLSAMFGKGGAFSFSN